MGFEWDENKEWLNVAKHGVSFQSAVMIFDDPDRLKERSDRRGEERWLSTGVFEGKTWAVAYVKRGDTIRIISARRAGKHEKERYHRSLLDRGDQADES